MRDSIRNASARSTAYRRLRLALDVFLILLVIWVALGFRPAGLAAQNGAMLPAAEASGLDTQAGTAAAPVVVDDETLAAMIAAENGALTPPIYFNELPVILR